MRVDLLPEDSVLITTLSSFRLEIDPSSNPGSSGWIINAPGSEQNIPWLDNNGPGFSLCEAYIDDPSGDYDMSNISTGIVKFNNSGYFNVSFSVYIISTVIETDGTIIMILKNGATVFSQQSGAASTRTQGDQYSILPGSYVRNLNSSGNVKINAGDELVVRILPNNVTPGNDLQLQFCTNFSCSRISNIGVLGSASNAGPVETNLENTGVGTTILQNNGIQPSTVQRNFKTLLAGTNMSFVDSGSDITLNSTGGGIPDSDFQNVGGGNAILNTTGVLPVTTTRNFKTLLAGTNVIITSTANNLSFAANNIYNTNGTLTSSRTVSLNSNNFTISGTGQVRIDNVGFTRIGNIGNTLQLNGNPSMPHLAAGSYTNAVLFDTATFQLCYGSAPTSGIFSQTVIGIPTITFPYAASYQMPSFGFGYTYGNNNANGFLGFNNAGITLDTVTGTYTPSVSGDYQVSCKVTLKNDTQVPNFELRFYDATAGQNRAIGKYNYGTLNTYNTYYLNNSVNMTAVRNYAFFMYLFNTAGTVTVEEVICEITKI